MQSSPTIQEIVPAPTRPGRLPGWHSVRVGDAPTFSRDYVLSILDFDQETGIFSWKCQSGYRSRFNGRMAGIASARSGHISIKVDGKSYLAHRLAWLCYHGSWPKGDIDHIDGDPANNRRGNLRAANSDGNARNRKVHANSQSGLKGVVLQSGKWRASILVDGERIALGMYKTEVEAARAYREAAIYYHGEFASWRGQ